MRENFIEKREIHGKPIYIFESHNAALEAWADIKTNHDEELLLVTLDHHTDTHEAFVGYAHRANNNNPDGVDPIMEERLARVSWRDKKTVIDAVADLKNDEQIDAALKLGLFSLAFCINNEHRNTDSEGRAIVSNKSIYLIGKECESDCDEKLHAEEVIESLLLGRLIDRANSLALTAGIEDVTQVPYVLDIDLDYFRTQSSLSPTDDRVFRTLIRNAVGITIATEPSYVRFGRLDGKLTSDYALGRVLEHIARASK
jgi:hypothetical protein